MDCAEGPKYRIHLIPPNSFWRFFIIIPTSQMSKLRPKEAEHLTQDYAATYGCNWDLR